MSKKSDDAFIFLLVTMFVGLVVATAAAVYGIGKLTWWGIQSYREKKRTQAKVFVSKNTDLVNHPMENIKTAEVAFFKSESRKHDPWLEHCLAIETAWDRGDYDWARMQLQRIAYGMVEPSVTDAQRADFTRLMTAFAKEDPFYKDVMERVRPLIRANPGMLQSQIYKGQPDETKEQMRYVLYFAHELGDIIRTKKGNSYKLTLPDEIIEGDAVKQLGDDMAKITVDSDSVTQGGAA